MSTPSLSLLSTYGIECSQYQDLADCMVDNACLPKFEPDGKCRCVASMEKTPLVDAMGNPKNARLFTARGNVPADGFAEGAPPFSANPPLKWACSV